MSEWKEYKLGEIASFKTGKLNSNAAVENGEYPFFTCSPITLAIDKYAYNQKAILLAGNNAEGNFSIKYYEGKFNAYQRTYIIESQENVCYLKFLYYSLMLCLQEFKLISQGTSTRFLTAVILNNFEILLPPLDEQKRIASILSSLDDKINLLNRENATLEAMAGTLFRQWFIEETKEDWEDKPLSAYGKIVCGKTPPKKETKYFGGAIPFIKIPDMHGRVFVFSSEDSLTEEGKMFQKEKTLPSGSIIVSCIATVGLVALNAKDSQTNQQINSIIPYKDEYRYFLFLHLRNMHDELNAMASGGTATLNLNTNNFSNIRIACPNIEMLTKFNQHVEPLFDKIFCNQKQIISLTKQRQELLPKLMSNEINV